MVTLIGPVVLMPVTWLEPTAMKLMTITGELAPVGGLAEVEVTIGEWSIKHKPCVVAVQDPCNLGMDFLEASGGKLDFIISTMSFPGHTAKMSHNPNHTGSSEGLVSIMSGEAEAVVRPMSQTQARNTIAGKLEEVWKRNLPGVTVVAVVGRVPGQSCHDGRGDGADVLGAA